MLHFSKGDIPHFSAMGGEEIYEAGLLQRTRKGRAFRRVRAAGDIRSPGEHMLQANQAGDELSADHIPHDRKPNGTLYLCARAGERITIIFVTNGSS